MKDPLQYNPTPYDILQIDATGIIDKKTVEGHFKKNFNKKGAREARNILNNHLDRAIVDIFFYEEIYFKKMLGKIFNNPDYLITKRERIAHDWEENQRKFFPYYPITHILAVFWFWWAVFEEERIWDKKGELNLIAPSLNNSKFSGEILWENAIVNWISVINSEEYLKEWIKLKKNSGLHLDPSTDIEKVKKRVELFIVGYFKKFSERYRLKDDLKKAQQYQNYELLFSSENKSAKNVSKIGYTRNVSGKNYKFCSGKILLEKTGFLGELREYIDNKLKQTPDDNKLKEFALGLSPFFSIRSLLEEKKYDKALESINKLSLSDQESDEIIDIKSICFFEKGKQLFSTGDLKKAFSFWENGFILERDSIKKKEEIISLCKEEAISFQKSSPDKAIEILETAIETIPDRELNKTLSIIYLDRGIKNMNSALQKIPPVNPNNISGTISDIEFKEIIEKILDVKKSITEEAEKALSDMVKAVSADPENSNAKEQLKIAKNNILDIELIDIYKAIEMKKFEYAHERINDLKKNGSINPKIKELQTALKSYYCWFCKNKKNPNLSDEESVIEVKLYKETQRDFLNVKWDILTVNVPRCNKCKEYHEKKKKNGYGIGCITGLIFDAIIVSIFHFQDGGYFWGVIVTLTIGIGWIFKILEGNEKNLTEKIDTKNNFPLIKEKIKEGWRFGDKPPDVNKT